MRIKFQDGSWVKSRNERTFLISEAFVFKSRNEAKIFAKWFIEPLLNFEIV